MEQNKIRTYLFYAIGEILLVVVGILIALQVNNWNEQRKNEATIKMIFTEIQQDLFNDIREFDAGLKWYEEMDTIATKTINGELSTDDFLNNEDNQYYQPGFNYYDLIQSDRSFELLTEYKDKLPVKYRDVMIGLNSLYEEDRQLLNTLQEHVIKTSTEYRTQISEIHPWAIPYSEGKRTPEMAAYFSKSVYHKQKVSLWRTRVRYLKQIAYRIKEKSVINYMIMRKLTGDSSVLPPLIQSYGVSSEPPLGVYEGIFYFTNEEGQQSPYGLEQDYGLVFWKNLGERGFYFENVLLTEVEKDSLLFVGANDYTLKILRDSTGEIIQMHSYYRGKLENEYTSNATGY